ncbi:hypothetical protein HDV05_006273 [Chytridiales sp. JEL 0842]|nr:hypothetical protein HDV05_006273 [Chytridiales sp. JEL 0842]
MPPPYPEYVSLGSWGTGAAIHDPTAFFEGITVIDECHKIGTFGPVTVTQAKIEELQQGHKVLVGFWEESKDHFKETWRRFSDAERRQFLGPLLPCELQRDYKNHLPSADDAHELRKEDAFTYLPDIDMNRMVESDDFECPSDLHQFQVVIHNSLPKLFEIVCKPNVSDVALACICESNDLFEYQDLCAPPNLACHPDDHYFVSLLDMTEQEALRFGRYFQIETDESEEVADTLYYEQNCLASLEDFYMLMKRLWSMFALLLRCADMYHALILQSTRRTRMISLGLIGCIKCSSKSPERRLKVCSRCRRVYYCSEECQRADWAEHRKNRCIPHENRKPLTLNDAEVFAMALYKLA